MINIIDKEDCVGCNACVQRCPKTCISMYADEQGFLYPVVDGQLCIDCHLCEKVCPVINQDEPIKPLATFAAKNPDDKVRMTSSSGGIFFALAKSIIEDGGVVFGAKFNGHWEVVHDYAETLEDLISFQGSKYVQSRIGDTFIQVEKFLKVGRKVMFTGTPCQIAALSLFLKKEYEGQLLKVDIACHGVPSPKVWQFFLNEIANNLISVGNIISVNFRDKRFGWQKYGLSIKALLSNGRIEEIYFASFKRNEYMQMYLYNLILRPSCFACPAKSNSSHSDITLSDCWGISKLNSEFNSSKGVSGVVINTKFGEDAFNNVRTKNISIDYSDFVIYNSALVKNAVRPDVYSTFWDAYNANHTKIIDQILKTFKTSVLSRIINRLKVFFR
ncbi:MAG: Coenzyme F420 hydrogenase/dehydrogenase, beta subunit C-terminal domain [Bacteroidales bacterium]|nr:Coenzyme F420 hydrogenase/dehydrogenase, beta subunit C-terminal domain [Bacteroidales bacterium]